jgi:hypothetical protein
MSLDIERIVRDQAAALDLWYADAPDELPPCEDLASTILAQHYCNFCVWNREDQARRTDIAAERIAAVKHDIDEWNQRRNDLMEAVDGLVLATLPEPDTAQAEQHSETVGMMIDRLSILALKVHHMRINASRDDDTELAAECAQKLATLEVQRDDLVECLDRLLKQCLTGQRYFRLYRQHKAYNDPRLNPALSRQGRGSL